MITLQHIPPDRLQGKRVFVLIDPNIQRALPAIRELRDKSVRLVLGTHLGKATGSVVEAYRLKDFARELSHFIGRPVRKLDEAIGPEVIRAVMEMKEGDIVLLENLDTIQANCETTPNLRASWRHSAMCISTMLSRLHIAHLLPTSGLHGGRRSQPEDHFYRGNWKS